MNTKHLYGIWNFLSGIRPIEMNKTLGSKYSQKLGGFGDQGPGISEEGLTFQNVEN